MNPAGESMVVTTTLAPASVAASTVPRSSSSAQGLCRLAISRSTTPKPSREEELLTEIRDLLKKA